MSTEKKSSFWSGLLKLDARAAAMLIVLLAFVVLLLVAPVYLDATWISEALGVLAPILTLIMGYYFGVKSRPPDAVDTQNLISLLLTHQSELQKRLLEKEISEKLNE